MLIEALKTRRATLYRGSTLVNGKACGTDSIQVFNPAETSQLVGNASLANQGLIEEALSTSTKSFKSWNALGGQKRAEVLRCAADLLENHRDDIIDLLVREAGKTLGDCIAELRETVDFCRYYAVEAEAKFSESIRLPGPTGETNELFLQARGVFLCISPWNFPLAIFTGQIMAALAAGNSVIAKPADQTPLIAAYAVDLFHKAGVPPDVLHLLLGSGTEIGAALVADTRISGVAFTGSTATAKNINKTLAERDGPIIPFIAETGGQNAMIVDSTALPEQVCDDVIQSAFGSAGQRCSALRVLYLQDSIADKIIHMLKGALKEIKIGYPGDLDSDIGPIIDLASCKRLEDHCALMSQTATLIDKKPLSDETMNGHFVAPHIFEIDKLRDLDGEKFGPVLHIIRFKTSEIKDIIEDILASRYGLTFGVHSRLEHRWIKLFEKTRAGNNYINRNMTGAVVGVQPFGGEGLSGTGPKAGGPHYLLRFAVERTLTINTAAVGGNAALFSLEE